jgi:flagellar protein FlbD
VNFIYDFVLEFLAMIEVTRLNNSKLWVNAEMIEFVEATPDTVISLINSDKIIVKNSPQEVVKAIVEYRRRILRKPLYITESEE